MFSVRRFLIVISSIFVFSNVYAETKSFTDNANKWRLEQYSGGVVLWYTPSLCNNGYLSAGDLSPTVQNRVYASVLASKLAKKPLTIYYEYTINADGGKSCKIISVAMDF